MDDVMDSGERAEAALAAFSGDDGAEQQQVENSPLLASNNNRKPSQSKRSSSNPSKANLPMSRFRRTRAFRNSRP